MTVKMTPGDLVFVPFYTEMIEIVAHYMHGDMNGHSTEVVLYPDHMMSDIHFDLEGLAFLKRYGRSDHDDLAHAARAFYGMCENLGHPEEDVEAFVEQFVVQDDTDDSYEAAAQLTRVEVFWYNDRGQKIRMDVTVNQEQLDDQD